MREAVIVATARTAIGKAYRGAFNNTQGQTLAGHAIQAAVARSGVAPGEVGDVILGAAMQQGSTGGNIGRQAALRAGLPTSVAGMSLDRQCASGLMAIATAAKQVMVDGMEIAIGGGVESISLVQNEHANRFRSRDPALVAAVPALYMTMLETAEIVADRYKISREAQDEYALQSQQRTGAAQAEGRFDAEIVPMTTTMIVTDKATGATSEREITIGRDEGNRPQTVLADLAGLKPVFKDGQTVKEGRFITAGNASQLSDGASAAVLMEAKEAERRGLQPLGAYRGMAVAGTEATSAGSRLRKRLACSFCTSEIDSTPPPIAISMPSTMICLAAIEIAIRPEAHWRSTDMPATLVGSPARNAHCRATLPPVAPCCKAAPMITSSTSAPGMPARPTAASIAWPPSVCAGVSLKAPR